MESTVYSKSKVRKLLTAHIISYLLNREQCRPFSLKSTIIILVLLLFILNGDAGRILSYGRTYFESIAVYLLISSLLQLGEALV